MKKISSITKLLFFGVLIFSMSTTDVLAKDSLTAQNHNKRDINIKAIDNNQEMKRFTYDSGLEFTYPDNVRGIYVTGPSAGGERFNELVDLVDRTKLNSMVIDVKEDYGKLTFKPENNSKFKKASDDFIKDPKKLLKTLEKKEIYPIARVVVFKDSVLAKEHPEWSFKENGKVWKNGKGESFVNPFNKEVWEYNVEVAKMAAELGFKEIQFDYVRFPEGFETKDEELEYSLGDYKNSKKGNVKRRVEAVTDFVKYANKELLSYDVDVSVDIFCYAATIPETPGIGQNFSKISENVDVISSMVYPSHWTSYFGIEKPDKEPYRIINEYAKLENKLLNKLDNKPTSRPWIQDFEAPWLYPNGNTKKYGKAEVEAQIKALNENGINEYLIWNASNKYTKNVDYTPLNK